MRAAHLSLAVLVLLAACPAAAETCPPPDRPAQRSAKAKRDCAPAPRYEPYDPARVRAGRTPGFIDMGGGTEVRMGGRIRMDHDLRR